ncbi:methionine aminopeptidase [Yersinia massiliensis]|nr:methionine aminopeptidase [Yersinia massiliensis]
MVSVVRSGRCCVALAQQPDTLHLSSRRCVGCIRSPESLTSVSSSGFTYLPPSCNSKAIGYRNCEHLSSRRCVGCIRSPESLTSVSSSGFTYLPPSCDSKAIGYRVVNLLCIGCRRNGSLNGNNVRARLAILQLSNILHSSSRNARQRLFGQKCLMTGKQHVMT